jgi:hypothetical protein
VWRPTALISEILGRRRWGWDFLHALGHGYIEPEGNSWRAGEALTRIIEWSCPSSNLAVSMIHLELDADGFLVNPERAGGPVSRTWRQCLGNSTSISTAF